MPTQEDVRATLIARINRLEGQVRGLRKMMEEERPCQDVLLQVSAVAGAAKGLWRRMMEAHLCQCAAGQEADKGHAKMLEVLLKALTQF